MIKWILLLFIMISPQTGHGFTVKYPLEKSVVLSREVKFHIQEPFKKCPASSWKASLLEDVKEESKLETKVLSSSDSDLFIQVRLPENLRNYFHLKLGSPCGEQVIKLYRFQGSASQLAEKIFLHFDSIYPPEDLSYNWTSAVFLYALAEMSGPQYQDYIANYFKYHLKRGLPDITSPDLAAVSLPGAVYKEHGGTLDLSSVFEKTKAFFETEPVSKIGAFNHVGVRHRFFWFLPLTRNFVADSIWVDSLIMYALNGLKSAAYFKSEKIKEFSLQQPLIFSQYLQDSSGFFKHGYYLESEEKTPATSYWGRGNGWASVALVQFLEEKSENQSAYQASLEKLLQAVSHSLDRPIKVSFTLLQSSSAFNYPEASSTSLFAFALAKADRLKVFNGLQLARQMAIDLGGYLVVDENENFSLHQVSMPTDSFASDWYYTLLIRPSQDLAYGTGAFLLMLQEMQKNSVQF